MMPSMSSQEKADMVAGMTTAKLIRLRNLIPVDTELLELIDGELSDRNEGAPT